MALLARECGWDKDFIVKNLTERQLRRYCELIVEDKMMDLQLQTIAMSRASGYGSGNIKGKDFSKFIDSLDTRKKPLDLKSLQKMGYEIEDK